MFETPKKWAKKLDEWERASERRDWDTYLSLLNDKNGEQFFRGLMGWLGTILMFGGLLMGYGWASAESDAFTWTAFFVNTWWIFVLAAVVVLFIEYTNHPMRLFYRRRKELTGRRFW